MHRAVSVSEGLLSLPGNSFLEKTYAAGIPVPREIPRVTTANIRLFFNHSIIGFSVNTAL